jgi:hypothetical protein
MHFDSVIYSLAPVTEQMHVNRTPSASIVNREELERDAIAGILEQMVRPLFAHCEVSDRILPRA